MTKSKLFLLGIVASFAFVAFGGLAQGAELKTNVSGVRIESTTNIEQTSTALTFKGGFSSAVCEVTLRGTTRTGLIVVSTTGLTALGAVTEGRINRCSAGGATILTETMPWTVASDPTQRTGVLLERTTQVGIVGITLRTNFRIREGFGVQCLVPNANILFLYDNRGSMEVGGRDAPNRNNCEGLGAGELVGTWRVNPSTMRVTALLA